MVKDNFFVSIIVPTYNRALSIHKTLNSRKEQTHDNWECLVIDDKSTDNTKEVIMDYAKEDSRFRYLINDRAKGAQGARNSGIINANANWIVFFDSDDYMHSRFLEKMISHLQVSKVDIVTCFSNLIDFKTGNKMTTSSVESFIYRLKKKLEIKESITPHKWRHTFATNFLRGGGDLETLRLLMGHANLKTTQKYLHLSKNDIFKQYRKVMNQENM